MKVKELTKFDKALKKEFCTYLKKYFKEDCKTHWMPDDRISIDIDFKVTDGKEPLYLIIIDRNIYRINLNQLGSDINILDFKKYIDKFLNMEYVKKNYINTKDFKRICALYDSLDLKYKKDDIKEFYNAIASVLNKDYETYILDNNKIFAYSNKIYAKQDIYSDEERLTFMVHVYNDERVIKTSFYVDCEQINILTLAEGLVDMQKRLEEIIK